MTERDRWGGGTEECSEGRVYPVELYHGGQHRMMRTPLKVKARIALMFLVHIGRGVELAIAVSLALLLLGSAALGLIQIYDHFFGK